MFVPLLGDSFNDTCNLVGWVEWIKSHGFRSFHMACLSRIACKNQIKITKPTSFDRLTHPTKIKKMNFDHRTSNIEHRIMYSACREPFCRTVYFYKKDWAERNHPSTFDSAELVAGCGSIFDILRFAVKNLFSFIRDFGKAEYWNIQSTNHTIN